MAAALQYAQEELAPCSDNDPELLSDLERTLALLAFACSKEEPVAPGDLPVVTIRSADKTPVAPQVILDHLDQLYGAEARLKVRPTTAQPLLLDAEQVQRALINLIKNALETEASFVAVSVESSDSHVCFTVKDYGPGIAEEQRDKLFTPYFTS